MIHAENLHFSYPGAPAPTLHGLDFHVEQGETLGFLGPSGAGKSTTQNLLIGLLKGHTGTLEVMGKPLTDWGRDYYEHVGVCFELPNHYLKLTARENLTLFARLYGDRAVDPAQVLAQVGLEEHADKPVEAFSKGMKNRLNFARSMLHQPSLWFLDEPTSGLDPVNAMRIEEIVRERQAQGTTTFLTTHNMRTAETLCDRVAFLVEGRIAALDTPEALRRRYGRREVELRYTRDDAEVAETFPLDGLADHAGFQRALREEHLVAMHSQETSLEDVFAQVTGRALR